MANISVTVQDGNNITLVTTPTPTQVITIDRGIAGPAGPAGVPAGSQYQIQYNSGVSTFAASPNLTFNGSNLVLQSASSTTAFRITQTGTGNAFVVEDSASTDATPFVISASGDVGIGTTTPSSELHIARGDATSYDGAATDGQLAAGSTVFVQQTSGTNTGVAQIVFQSRITFPYNRIVSSGGSAPFMTFVTNNAERMRIDSAGNVGIGTAFPASRVDAFLAGSGSGAVITVGNVNNGQFGGFGITDGSPYPLEVWGNVLKFKTGGASYASTTEKMRLDASGNLGLGVTPSAFSLAGFKSFEVGGVGSGIFAGAGDQNILVNAYYSINWKYAGTGTAIRYQMAAGEHRWYTAPSGTAGDPITFTQAMTLDASGNLGVGVTPSAWNVFPAFQTTGSYALSALGYSNNMFYQSAFKYMTTDLASRYEQASGQHRWFNAPSGTAGNPITFTQAMTLDASGNLGVGTTIPASYGRLVVNGTTSMITNGSVRFYNSANNNWSYIDNPSTDGTAFLRFATGGGEAARIDSSGNLLVGTTTTILAANRKLQVEGAAAATLVATGTGGEPCAELWQKATSGDNRFLDFFTETSVTARGSITFNRTAGLTSYNITSDYRAKDISGPVVNSGALIDSVPVYMGKMKDATQERPMFIAHEVPAYAHTGVKDAVDADGKPVYQQMDASALIPVMWAEIQDLRKRLAALEATPFASYEQFGIPKP